MVRLREVPRTAAFAWSPGPGKPLLVTGTRAGAVDADFSDETKLELWDLNLDTTEQGLELQPLTTIGTESRFYDIAWGPPSEEHPRGIIAGAMENGSLDLWDAEKLIDGKEDALMSRTTKHTGPIKALQFNPIRPQILATAGAKGEVFVWDVEDLATPFRLGAAAAHDIECLAWNRRVANILATGGSGGFVTVWDLKTKKASLTLNNNRKPVSSIQWDPNHPTKLLTATPDDNAPVIYLWDLKNSNAPERTLQGHEQGVLSMSWCQQDPELLISCGKDNRTLIWNPLTGERYGEFPEVTNWTFLTRFSPSHPYLSATASFDGKITIQTLQNTNASSAPAAQNSVNDEDFFTKAQTQPQGASFTLPKAPAWNVRPVGVSFAYGGKLVTFRKNKTAPSQKASSTVQISQFSVDSDIGSETEKFELALSSGDVAGICATHLENAKTEEEKAEWQVLQVLNEADGRTKIIEHLGFSKDEATNGVEGEQAEESKDGEGETPAAQANGKKASGHRRAVSMWGEGDDGDDFLSELAATKGAKVDNPFHLLSQGNTALEDQVTKALILGDFAQAAETLLKEERWADAFIVANCGGKDLLEKVQSAYLAHKKGSPSYLRLLSSVVTKNLWDVVYNADLSNWKETMVTLCTFADPSEFPDLCEALGDRIIESGSRKDGCFCYLVGSKLEKVVSIWIDELAEAEKAGTEQPSGDSTFSVHARSLQQFIEKVTVFRLVTKFTDSEKNLTSEWKLAALYDKYVEYADIAAAHGLLAVAQKYLDLLPDNYPAAEAARNRVKLATQKGAPKATPQTHVSSRPNVRQQPPPLLGYPGVTATPSLGASPMNPYAQQAKSQPQPPAAAHNPYAPPGVSQYQPPGAPAYGARTQSFAPPAPTGGYPGPQGAYGQPTPGQYGAPPRSSGPPPTGPPPRAKDVGVWNDVPLVTKPPTRKNTPSVAPITSPFPGQAGLTSPPPTGPFQRGAPTPPPPPPKGPAPPRNITSPLAGPPQAGQQFARPQSSTSASGNNPYAPPPPAAGAYTTMAPQTVPRTASPYNAPPAGAPPSNRYAPAPASQHLSQPPISSPLAPPPSASRPPPSNPYAPAPQQAAIGAPSPYASSPYQAGPPLASRPPVGPPPPMGAPPSAGPSPRASPPGSRPPPATAPPPAAAPPKARHPPGDRSHIPDDAKQLVDILSQDMQRVAAKAPPSFAQQVTDAQKRLELLFDDLNNQERVQPDTILQLNQLAGALASRNYDVASRIQVEIQRDKTDECGKWMVGVKRLIAMSKATP